jgi:hypothetical protein
VHDSVDRSRSATRREFQVDAYPYARCGVTTPCMTAPDLSLPPSRVNSWSHGHQRSNCSACSIDNQSCLGVRARRCEAK